MRRINTTIVTVICTLNLLFAQQGQIPYGNNPANGQYAQVNGTKIYYEVYGSGQPLVLLHGNGGSIQSRAAMIDNLAKKYRVIAIDSRCHGKSACMSGDLTYEMMAKDVKELLDKIQVDSAFIWGHSDGGIIGLIMAYTYPVKVKKLLTTGANVLPDSSAIQPELVEFVKMYPKIPDTLMRKQVKLMAFHPNIAWEKLKQIKAPTLIMAGDRDAIRNEHSVKLFNTIPNAQLCILPGTTHFVSQEKPALFMLLFNEFFEKPFSKPSTVEMMKPLAEQLFGK